MTMSRSSVVAIDPEAPSPAILGAAADILRSGGLVVAPTETRYGLLGRADEPEVVAAVYGVKNRSAVNPIAVFVSSLAGAERFAVISSGARRLAARFLPGPLTLVLASRGTDDVLLVRAGKIGCRVSSSAVIAGLLARVSFPLTATSANKSGQPEPSSVAVIAELFSDKVALYLDGGLLTAASSTVVDCSGDEPVVRRRGAVSVDAIQEAWRRT
jgi:L-threonylcarbamoyladenylate synthase